MRDVVVGHRKDHQLGNRAGQPANAPSALEEGREVAVHVARITAAPGDLLACRRKLAQGLAVACDVGEDHEYVESSLECEVLGDGQRCARR